MRVPRYHSVSSINTFYSDREEYYLKYLADETPPRLPQTQPMSVGSSFDAYVKSYLYERLKGTSDHQFRFENLFEAQVEEHNRDFAREAGKEVFDAYKASGALLMLMVELDSAEHIQFELTVEDYVNGIYLLGKPDVYFVSKYGYHVVYDWKVRGYCAKTAPSPTPGYMLALDGWEIGDHSRSHKKTHKNFSVRVFKGSKINANPLDQYNSTWAQQLATYAWLLGEEVGSEFVIGIDEIVGRDDIRIALHRAMVSKEFQNDWMTRIQRMDQIIKSGHIFDDISREESDAKCKQLNRLHKAYEQTGGNPDHEAYFKEITRQHRAW